MTNGIVAATRGAGHGLGTTLGWLFGWGSFLLWTVVLGLCIALDTVFGPRRRFSAHAMAWTWGRGHFCTSPLWRVRRRGLEHVAGGPWIVVSNHRSAADIPCILGIGPPMRIAARDAVFRVPLMGSFLRWSHQVHTDRFLEEGQQCLEEGLSLLVFPEGTRSADGRLQAFRGGAFRLAMQTGVPILPVAVSETQFVMPKGRLRPVRTWVRCEVEALEPIDPARFPSAVALRDHVKAAIAQALGQGPHTAE